MTRWLTLLNQIFKPIQAETAHIYLGFAVAWEHAVAGLISVEPVSTEAQPAT